MKSSGDALSVSVWASCFRVCVCSLLCVGQKATGHFVVVCFVFLLRGTYLLCYAWGKEKQARFLLFFCCVCIIMFFAMRRANSNRPVSSVAVCVCSLLCVRQRATGQFWLLLCACDTLKCLQCLRGQSKCCFSVCVHLCTKAVCHASVKFNSSLFVFLLILTKTNSHVEYY